MPVSASATRAAPHAPSVSRARYLNAVVWLPFVLASIGLVFQFSVGIAELLRLDPRGGAPSPLEALRPALMQTAWMIVGALAMGLCASIRGRLWLGTAWLWLILGLLGLMWLALKLPNSITLNAATRWIGLTVPGVGLITVQPAEFFKWATLL
ncbi:MAG: FtsW/RodA/SpoVE family cell cycle protein, partial [Fimbriimonadales bacterium]